MEKDIKILFDKIGTEKPSKDFTELIMRKIEAENPYFLSLPKNESSYWFLLTYAIAMALVIPFVAATIKWIINIDWSFLYFDISVIREWIGSFSDFFTGIAISPQMVIISISCSVLLTILTLELLVETHRKIVG
jgi:hypothetical protein